MNMRLIAIAGRKQAGKTTLARSLRNYLHESYGVEGYRAANVWSFAQPLKDICWVLGLYDSTAKMDRENCLGWTQRETLQRVGSALRRERSTFWIDLLAEKADWGDNENHVVVIDDLRYSNEVDWLKANDAYIIRLCRGETGDDHPSETELTNTDHRYDLVVPMGMDARGTFTFVLYDVLEYLR